MKHFVVAALLCAGLIGCQKTDPAAQKKIEELTAKADKLEKRVDRLQKFLDPIIAQSEQQQRNQPQEPDPKDVMAVPITADDPIVGPANAKITIVEGFDFACPYCFRAAPTVDEVVKKYGADVRVVYKYFLIHENALDAGFAACAANKQGKFPEMYKLIWEKGFKTRDLSKENLEKLAAEAKLDPAKFKKDMDSDACKNWVQTSQAMLHQVGTNGTPAFYINGRFLNGAQPIEAFAQVIDEEKAKTDAAVAAGTKVEDYYEKAVVQNGKKTLDKKPAN